MTNAPETSLPSFVATPEQLGTVIIELRLYVGKLADRGVRRKVADMVGEPMPPLSRLSEQVLDLNQVTPADGEKIEKLLHALEKIRDHAPTAHITLADLPDTTVRQELITWFRQNIHPQTFLTFAARGDIGGGFLMQAGTRQYDFTFRSQLLGNKLRIGELFAALTATKEPGA